MQREDMGVGQPGGDVDLLEETLGAQNGREFRVKGLYRHRSAVFQVSRPEHDRHASAADLTFEFIST